MPDEPERLKALAQYDLSSTQTLPSLGPVVEIAARIFDVPSAAVNLVGHDEVFFAASYGVADCDMAREVSFCAHAITQDDVMVVEDAHRDPRFRDNPLVTGPAQIRFYAGVPVRSSDGFALGALCIIDSKPHASFSGPDRAQLRELAELVSDRLELRRLDVAGQQGLRRFERMTLATPSAVICVDGSGTITTVNPAAERLFGYAQNRLAGQALEVVMPDWKDSAIARQIAQTVTGAGEAIGTVLEGDLCARHAAGDSFPVEVVWTAWMEHDEPNLGLVIRDLREQRRQQDELHHLANFDKVTGLPNLSHFRERLAGERSAAILALGLGGYDVLSATLGSRAGEDALRQVADRLRLAIRPVDMVARIASDEFAICLNGVGDPLRAREAAIAAMAAIARPLDADGDELHLQPQCGIALCPSHGSEPAELVGNARLALQEARRQGGHEAVLFAPALRMAAVARRMFDAELHHAAERGEFELYFQPQARLSDGLLTGAEALLRWNHPQRGVLAPAAFLPALEASPLAELVGAWIIDSACRSAGEWRHELSPDFRMSINLFAAQFCGGQLHSTLSEALARYRLPGEAIELEITETTVVDSEATFLPLLERLRADGVRIAFDDFGTGFASLSLLARYPLTHLKIDKSFTGKALACDRDRAIVQAMSDLAHRLQLEVIAEGVESWASFDMCREIGCDEAQGFLIGRPVPAAQFGAAWRRWQGLMRNGQVAADAGARRSF